MESPTLGVLPRGTHPRGTHPPVGNPCRSGWVPRVTPSRGGFVLINNFAFLT